MLQVNSLIDQWKDHQDHLTRLSVFKEQLTTRGYNVEMGGMFRLYPRQFGKTTAMKKLASFLQEDHKDQVFLVCPYQSQAEL